MRSSNTTVGVCLLYAQNMVTFGMVTVLPDGNEAVLCKHICRHSFVAFACVAFLFAAADRVCQQRLCAFE